VTKGKPVIIFGCGSQARYIIDIALDLNVEIVGMVNLESEEFVGETIHDVSVLSSYSNLSNSYKNPELYDAAIGHGNNKLKDSVWQELKSKGFSFPNFISPKASISRFVKLGEGIIVNPGACILNRAQLGNLVIVHSGVVVEHDNLLSDFVNIAPGVALAGNVTIGRGSYVYTGANIAPGIKVGDHCVIGAGACVLRDLDSNQTVVGVPAKPISDD